MALVVPNASEVEMLNRIVTYEGSKLKLYTNNYTPVEGSTVGNFIECAAAGYAAKSLATGSWSTATGGGGTSASTYAEQEFAIATAVSCYGYFITNSAASVLLWAEIFTGAPFTLPAGGGSIKVTPYLGLD